MRFIHAADIHLDSPLAGLALGGAGPAGEAQKRMRSATREALARLVSCALDEAVDFLVLAGDLYDGDWRDFSTGIFLAAQMGRLRAAGIPVFVLMGNHDADSQMTRSLALPDNVQRFSSSRAETFRLPDLQVALHGRSFKRADTTDNLALSYPAPVPGWFNIGVLHTALEGNAAHARYAPCSPAELEARGYDYWALGHVHEHRVWQQGRCTLAYPGNLQGRHIRESGPRGALLVEQAEPGAPLAVRRLLVDTIRWQALAVDVSAAADLEGVLRLTQPALQAAWQAHEDGQEQEAREQARSSTSQGSAGTATECARPLVLRLSLRGASAAHGALFGREAQLRAELLAQVAALEAERLWIEQVQLQTTAPPDAGLAARGDALADLHAVLAEAPADAEFCARLREELMQMVGRLPAELLRSGLLAELPELEALRGGDAAPLLRQTLPGLMAHLAQAGPQGAEVLADPRPASG